MSQRSSVTTAGLVLASVLLAGPAGAATQLRQGASQPTNFCQAALPAFEGQIRKRPLAVQNEGTATAFVTCSYPTGEGRTHSTSATQRIWQYILNNGPTSVTIQCTGVTGDTGSGAQYLSKSMVLAADATAVITWGANEFAGAPSTMPNFGLFSASCQLPPGAGLGNAYIDSVTDVGS